MNNSSSMVIAFIGIGITVGLNLLLLAYQWGRFQQLVQQLTDAIKRLQEILDRITDDVKEHDGRIIRLETHHQIKRPGNR